MKRKTSTIRSHCPISFALDMFGDKWTLLIMRDLALKNWRYYGDFLAAEEGIATNILAERLSALQRNGIITRERDSSNRRRWLYRLTESGADLLPVLVELIVWSAKYDPQTEAPDAFVQRARNDREALLRDLRSALPSAAELS